MKATFVFIITLYVAVTSSASEENIGRRPSLPEHSGNGRYGIWGSVNCSIDDYPYTAAIVQTAFESLNGGGFIYNGQWIVTTGYAGTRNPPDQIYVRVGSRDATGHGQKFNVIKVITHPDFAYCVCLLKLDREIEFGETARPIQIASKQPASGSYVTVTGFGQPFSPLLRRQITITIGREICLKQSPDVGTLTELDFCALSGPSLQDSGDPMMYRGEAVAVFIRDKDKFFPTPGVYCDITKMRKWIDKTIQENGDTENEDEDNSHKLI